MTDENVRQRRGKKSSSASPSAGSSQETTPIEQLRNAQAKLIVSRDRTADLHSAWRGQLFRLSILVFFVAIYQLQQSISACISEIKDSNEAVEGEDSGAIVTGGEAIKLIFGDSFCELVGVFVSSFLAYFLALGQVQEIQLEHWSYMVSSALVPLCLGLFFNSTNLGCIGEDVIEGADGSTKDQRHQFPAVVVYHTIVTVAFWFMKSGLQQCQEHVDLVTKSISDFERMEKKLEKKKQLKKAVARKK